MSSYDPAIPQPNDILSQSQGDLLINFTELDTYLKVNHVAFADANFGKHSFVTLTKQDPGLATTSTEIGLYCHDDAFGNPQLYYKSGGTPVSALGTQLTPIPSIFAWGKFDNTGALVGDSYNVTSVTTGGTGNFTINFTNSLASGNYFPWFMPESAALTASYPNVKATTVNSITVQFTSTGTTVQNITSVNFMIWGD